MSLKGATEAVRSRHGQVPEAHGNPRALARVRSLDTQDLTCLILSSVGCSCGDLDGSHTIVCFKSYILARIST